MAGSEAFLWIFKGSGKAMMVSMDSASYSCYIGISLMMLVGFGYLKAFLKASKPFSKGQIARPTALELWASRS